jgi:hypothetical protein
VSSQSNPKKEAPPPLGWSVTIAGLLLGLVLAGPGAYLMVNNHRTIGGILVGITVLLGPMTTFAGETWGHQAVAHVCLGVGALLSFKLLSLFFA